MHPYSAPYWSQVDDLGLTEISDIFRLTNLIQRNTSPITGITTTITDIMNHLSGSAIRAYFN
jgi:hypothetical protein